MIFHKLLPFLSIFLLSINNVSAMEDMGMELDEEDCMYMALDGECKTNPELMKKSCDAKICQEWFDEYGNVDLESVESFYDLSANDIDGNKVDFNEFKDKIVVIVNVASYCGYTEQHYKELVELHSDLKGLAVEILAFPCNQFGSQEPDAPAKIKQFAKDKGVKFRIMEKIDVNGKNSSMVYKWIKNYAGPFKIDWNFATYFVVDVDGDVEEFTGVSPSELKDEILMLLDQEEL